MRKLKRNIDAAEFSKLITNESNAWKKCVNCKAFNDSCVELAKKGKCKAFNSIYMEEYLKNHELETGK